MRRLVLLLSIAVLVEGFAPAPFPRLDRKPKPANELIGKWDRSGTKLEITHDRFTQSADYDYSLTINVTWAVYNLMLLAEEDNLGSCWIGFAHSIFDKDEVDGANGETRSEASLQAHENRFGPQSRNLASVLRGFKSAVTTFARHREIEFQWQARFHERIIRNQNELERIQSYIITNPSRWQSEHDNGEGLYR